VPPARALFANSAGAGDFPSEPLFHAIPTRISSPPLINAELMPSFLQLMSASPFLTPPGF
jgi:hypothetical protein